MLIDFLRASKTDGTGTLDLPRNASLATGTNPGPTELAAGERHA
ncbi:hypothetical protein ACE7GA_00225 [Roseomonas sp. CCTCC AB2023176]